MREITLEEIEKQSEDSYLMIDMRPKADYDRGSYPGAFSVPDMDLAASGLLLPKDRPIYILCHTGLKSPDQADALCAAGYDAWSVAGGYRTYLKRELDRFLEQEEEIEVRTKEIERSLIKKYRKNIWCRFTKAIREYELIQDGDKVACCISGGKDSMIMAKLLQELQRHGKVHFDLVFLCMNPGYNEDNWRIIEDNARILGLELNVFNTDIFDVVAGIENNPCYLCARMRRGYLYSHAKELGCNKIALGHHYDDVIETILMGVLYSGKTETMMPKLHSQHFEGMEIIRPLYLIREQAIKSWRDANDLHFIQCACRFTENCASCGGGRESKRDVVKQLIANLAAKDPIIEQNIFSSVRNVNLNTILGYHRDEMEYSFLDDYDERGKKKEVCE